jgi:predicted Zn-dependent protease
VNQSGIRHCCVLLVLIGVSACAMPRPVTMESNNNSTTTSNGSQTSGVQTQSIETPDSPVSQPIPVITPKTLSPATKALVTQAQTQLNAGQDAAAASTLERALRIEPDNPLIWLEMAKLRHTEGNPAQAESMARKALSMAGGDARVQAAAWRVIADSFRARGRNPEARDADARAAALSGN